MNYLDLAKRAILKKGPRGEKSELSEISPLSPDLFELWQERAAIREYDGKQLRDDAEAGAWDDLKRLGKISRGLARSQEAWQD